MALLLDTHVFLWSLAGDRKLSRHARAAIADPEADDLILVSNEKLFDAFGVTRLW